MYMTTRAAATYICMSKSYLDKARVYGGGPQYMKIGGAIRYSREDLDNWLAGKVRTSTFGGAANDDGAPALEAAS